LKEPSGWNKKYHRCGCNK